MSTPLAPRPDGLVARRLASAVIEDVVKRHLPLDDRLEKLSQDPAFVSLQANDRGLTRAIATVALRRYGLIRHILAEKLTRGFPPNCGRLESFLIAAAAQILVLKTAPHAAVDTAITLIREDKHARHFADLANAVLRRIAAERDALLSHVDPLRVDTPLWLAERWIRSYGEATASTIATMHREEPSVDVSVKSEAEAWADRLGAIVLPTGSLRLTNRTAIPLLPGFAEGEWWVQDAAAAIPARLLKAMPGQRILDLCAAPGGKTAQLAITGAAITAVDRSASRMAVLQENMLRLKLAITTEVSEATAFTSADLFDGILLDAPCSATGTIRRHPDVAWGKTLQDVVKLANLQQRLLDHAATLLRLGGTLVYASCSLEPEEGEQQINRFLERHPGFKRQVLAPAEVAGCAELLTPVGDLRCLPSHWPNAVDRLAGMDGFFASRLVRESH